MIWLELDGRHSPKARGWLNRISLIQREGQRCQSKCIIQCGHFLCTWKHPTVLVWQHRSRVKACRFHMWWCNVRQERGYFRKWGQKPQDPFRLDKRFSVASDIISVHTNLGKACFMAIHRQWACVCWCRQEAHYHIYSVVGCLVTENIINNFALLLILKQYLLVLFLLVSIKYVSSPEIRTKMMNQWEVTHRILPVKEILMKCSCACKRSWQ